MTLQSVAGQLMVVVGVGFMAVAAVGLVRLPDVYNRTNAVTKAASLGVVCVLLGVVVLAPGPGAAIVLLAASALQLFTVPIAGFEIGAAARTSGAPLAAETHRDDIGLPGAEDPARD